jgi:hypothetical protein
MRKFTLLILYCTGAVVDFSRRVVERNMNSIEEGKIHVRRAKLALLIIRKRSHLLRHALFLDFFLLWSSMVGDISNNLVKSDYREDWSNHVPM